MAGLPVLIVFMALLLFSLWQALHNWVRADAQTRPLLCSGIAAVVALSVNSVSINGWTLPPLAALGWLIAGTISSPLISGKLHRQMSEERRLYSVQRNMLCVQNLIWSKARYHGRRRSI